MLISKFQLLVFIIASIFTFGIVFSFISLWGPNNSKEFFSQFFTEGYDFRKFQSGDEDFAKYVVGSKIDLTKLVSTEGNGLLLAIPNELLLLNVIDPQCGYCSLSKDIIRKSRQTTEERMIGYVPVLFTSAPDEIDIRKYVQTLGFSECYRWEAHSMPPEIFISMPTPSHILVNRKGIILQVWFSSNKYADIRVRMSNQLTSDLLLIDDVIKASLVEP